MTFYIPNDESKKMIKTAQEKYENYFGDKFPLYEYLKIIDGTITFESVEKLMELVDTSIKNNERVITPEDYWERKY